MLNKKAKRQKETLMDTHEYEAMYHSEETMWWYKGLRDVVKQTLQQYLPKPCTILDAGCGTGKTMEMLIQQGYRVKGIDSSEEALAFCKKRNLKHIQYGSVTSLPFPDASFDCILCMDVLGMLYKQDIEKALREFYRVLKPGGIVIIQCAALAWLRSQHDDVTNLHKRYRKHDLIAYLDVSRWQLKKATYRIFFLFLPVMLVKLKKKVLSGKLQEAKTDQYVPPTLLNTLLTAIQIFENKILQKTSLPIGSSVFLVVKKTPSAC